MNPRIVAVLAVLAIAGAIIVSPKILATVRASTKKTECDALRTRLDSLRAAGGDLNEAARVTVELNACLRASGDAGNQVSLGAELVAQIDGVNRAVAQEYESYKATSYVDPLKRTNQRRTMVRLQGELAERVNASASMILTRADAVAVVAALDESIRIATDRYNCHRADGSGCGRYNDTVGSIFLPGLVLIQEQTNPEKMTEDIERAIVPLTRARDTVAARFGLPLKSTQARDRVAATFDNIFGV